MQNRFSTELENRYFKVTFLTDLNRSLSCFDVCGETPHEGHASARRRENCFWWGNK